MEPAKKKQKKRKKNKNELNELEFKKSFFKSIFCTNVALYCVFHFLYQKNFELISRNGAHNLIIPTLLEQMMVIFFH